jgi:hypothetical protein
VKLRAAWQRLKAAYESEQLALEVQVSLLKLTQEVGQFVLALFRDDKASFHDDLKRELQRPSVDEAKVIAHYLWQLDRYANDQAAVNDHTTQGLGKQSHDSVVLVDQSNVTVQKLLSERPVVVSWAYRLIAKPLTEACLLLDENVKQTGKDAKDTASAMDRLRDDFLKAILDAVFVEASTQRALLKRIADLTTITDDVDGATSAEDDQEIAFLKQVQHRLTVGDQLARTVGYERAFAEQALVAMSLMIALDRALAERATFTDGASHETKKPQEDFLFWSEQMAQAISRMLHESSTASDRPLKQLDKASLESLTVHEARLIAFLKQVGDAISVSDRAAIKPAKGFIDAASFADQIVRSIGFIRAFNEIPQITDALSRSPTKLGADSSFLIDQVHRQIEKNSGEEAILTDTSHLDVFRTALESAFISSVSVRFLERRLTLDVLGASDALMRLLGRVQGEALSFSDQLRRALGTALLEQTVLIEQLAKHGNVLLRHGTSFLDRVERLAGKRLNDVVTMTDSGYWDQQSYAADPAFFAADYVGKRQFF